MNVKTDTKEKFHAITIVETSIPATMSAEMGETLLDYLQNDGSKKDLVPTQADEIVKNVVLNLKEVASIEMAAAEKLVYIQQKFYENNASFVICELQKQVEEYLDENGLLEMMNVTPTESEAWDIVQMEEIEREFLDEE